MSARSRIGDQRRPRSSNSCRGIALIAVVIVIALITTSALTFALLMQQSNQTARGYAEQQQSQWAMASAIAQLEALAARPPAQRSSIENSQSAAMFLRSIELQLPSTDLGGLGALGTAESDWVSNETGVDQTLSSDVTDFLDDPNETFDPTQPGFIIFDWNDGSSNGSNGSNAIGVAPSATMFAPEFSEGSELTLRLGWTNESSKLHLSRLLQWEAAGVPVNDLLQRTCGLSPAQADRLLDWMDADDQPRAFGAETSAYAQRGVSYRPANQVPHTVDSLLLIPGFSPRQLYGQRQSTTIRVGDTASGRSESAQALSDFTQSQQAQIDRDLQALPDSAGNEVDRSLLVEIGLVGRLTVTSKERHQNPAGQLKLPLNHPDLQQLFTAVSGRIDPNLATYLCLARQYGVQEDSVSTPSSSSSSPELALDEIELDFSQPPRVALPSLVSLIDSYVRVPQAEGTFAVVRSPLGVAELQEEFALRVSDVFDELTAAERPVTESRIHWQLADPQLLMAIPGLTAETRVLLMGPEQWTNSTTGDSSTTRLTQQAATWYRDGVLDRSQWQILDRELTDGGDVFSAYVGAHAGDYRAFRWGHVIVDASEKRAQQVYYRELLPPPPTVQAVMATLNEITLE